MLALLSLLTACSPDKAPTDDGSTHDSAVSDDTGVSDDSGVSDDTSVSDDSGVSDDTGDTEDTATYPPEDCTNGEDDDHDGLIDCEDGDCWDVCVEVCNNGEDDDQDGLIDCEDDDCDDAPLCDTDRQAYHFSVGQGQARLQHHLWLTTRSYSIWSSSSGRFTFDIQSGTVQNSASVRCAWTGTVFLHSSSWVGDGGHLNHWFQRLNLSAACPFALSASVLSASGADLDRGEYLGDPARWTLRALPGMSPDSDVIFSGLRTASTGDRDNHTTSFQLTQTASWTEHLTPTP